MDSIITTILNDSEARSERGIEAAATRCLNELSIPWAAAESTLDAAA
jgi:hypothetical protein